ncbi:MAG: SDR family oxidoreductase [Chloroflexi bacterium AL-W]|nr:SDR family oxidoreductase [Chloroflexi bacterium AL-N1]NOK71641.1 SDR family oxidoreductase [Chloroflexi bacterium AL-N10]NOK78941.1 SDR family oxidoreductase [Chloroflexi bacterium AL-N5]NOK86416.1 SDR family oxidoreductase [Chloroflexi bacterium AL-W]
MFSAGTAIDGAISAMARLLAVELAPRGIRVNAFSPGLIKDTQIQSNVSPDQTGQFVQKTIAAIPLKRSGIPAEVADAARFLAHCA